MSCPVCYEAYDGCNVIARKLQCGDHICWKCVAADTYNDNGTDVYYCPECGYLNTAKPNEVPSSPSSPSPSSSSSSSSSS